MHNDTSTTAISLLNITPALARELEDPAGFERSRVVSLRGQGDLVADVVSQTEEFRARIGAPTQWCGYLGIDGETAEVVGTCGFKGAPDAAGMVEIAYFTFPRFEGRGYATAMATALIARVAPMPAVKTVRAYTTPKESASTHVLTRLGFICEGEMPHPENGTVWCWSRPARR